jgi:EmrB/QacA subfamily drug resistance transporter
MSTHAQRIQEKAFDRRWLILVVLCVSLLVIVLDNSILNVALPTIQKDLDATSSDLQWIVDAYTLVFAGLLLTAGSLGDRYGRRGALQLGFALFGIGSVASAMATSSGQLISTRAFMGIGGALIMPATLSIITNLFPAHERGKAIGAWAGVAGLGGALGPLTGGFLVEHFYWGSVFLVNIPIVIFGLLAGFFVIPTSKDPHAAKLDPLGAVLSIAGLTGLLYAIIEAPAEGWGSGHIVIPGTVGIVLLLAFVWWERTIDHPMLDVSFFKKPRFTAASASITLVFFAMFGSLFLLTQYFQYVLGYTPLETGVRMLPFAGAMMVVSPLSARVVERIGTKITVAVGLGMVTAGLLTMAGLQTDTPYSNIFWRLMLMAAGMGLTMAPATDSVMGSLPLFKAGVGSAVNDTTRQVGGALGVAIVGSVLAGTYGDKITAFFAGTPVPDQAVEAARSSIGAVPQVAQQLTQNGLGDVGAQLQQVANTAFVDAAHWGVIVAAVATGIGVLVALAFLPATAEAEDRAEQEAEYGEEHASEFAVPAAPAAAPHAGRERTAPGDGPQPVPEPAPEY